MWEKWGGMHCCHNTRKNNGEIILPRLEPDALAAKLTVFSRKIDSFPGVVFTTFLL
jgi:hypothetical protein